MTTATASRPVHVSTSVLVALVALVGIAAGLLLGYAIGTQPGSSTATAAVAADNAAMDDLLATIETGTEADLQARLLPTFRFTTTSGEEARNPAAMWALAQSLRTSMARAVRTSDVTRQDDVVFLAGRYEYTYPGAEPGGTFTWTVRVAPDGRIASIQETMH